MAGAEIETARCIHFSKETESGCFVCWPAAGTNEHGREVKGKEHTSGRLGAYFRSVLLGSSSPPGMETTSRPNVMLPTAVASSPRQAVAHVNRNIHTDRPYPGQPHGSAAAAASHKS